MRDEPCSMVVHWELNTPGNEGSNRASQREKHMPLDHNTCATRTCAPPPVPPVADDPAASGGSDGVVATNGKIDATIRRRFRGGKKGDTGIQRNIEPRN